MKTDFGAFGKSSNISIFKSFKFSILFHATTCAFMVSVFWKGHTRTFGGFYISFKHVLILRSSMLEILSRNICLF